MTVGRFADSAAMLARLGADDPDDDELRRKKALLGRLAILIAPVSFLWGCL